MGIESLLQAAARFSAPLISHRRVRPITEIKKNMARSAALISKRCLRVYSARLLNEYARSTELCVPSLCICDLLARSIEGADKSSKTRTTSVEADGSVNRRFTGRTSLPAFVYPQPLIRIASDLVFRNQ